MGEHEKASLKPVPKVTAAGLGGAVATLVLFVANLCGVEVPPGVSAAIATVVAFGAGYLTRP